MEFQTLYICTIIYLLGTLFLIVYLQVPYIVNIIDYRVFKIIVNEHIIIILFVIHYHIFK